MRNFHKHQDQAFARTAKLIVWLILAAAGTVMVTGAVLTYLFVLMLTCLQLNPIDFQLQLFEIFLLICLVTAMLLAASSWHKMMQLREGGKVIALDLGGQLIEARTSNRYERRVLNVVEEMAVSAGISVPTVYLLPNQPGINAFAAGLTFEDAVIGVTQGCIERLSRDQLQGVIAHEFSHILNGDMRLNLKLVGVLHGLLGISLFAEALIQSAHELSSAPSHHHDPAGELGLAALMSLTGILLWPVGLIGTLFGLLVMSATSRQREFLADAFAVQFTRNPEGLAGALKVLAGCEAGSRVRTAKSLEARHFFFAEGGRWVIGLMATHPPLDERIRRLDPQWDGVPLFEEIDELDETLADQSEALALVTGRSNAATVTAIVGLASGAGPASGSTRKQDEPPEASFLITTDAAAQVRDRCWESLSNAWRELALDSEGCQAIALAVWIAGSKNRTGAVTQLGPSWRTIVDRVFDEISRLDEAQQMLLFDVACDALDGLSLGDRSDFRQQVQQLLDGQMDQSLDLVQWAIGWRLRRRLEMVSQPSPRPRYGKLTEIQPACEVSLSALCHAGADHAAMAQYAFQRAAVGLDLLDPEFWSLDDLSCERLDAAIQLIAEAAPRPRRRLLASLGRCLSADGGITMAEAHFVRGFCAALSLPDPCLLPGQVVALPA